MSTQHSIVRATTATIREMIDAATPITPRILEVLKREFGSARVVVPGVTGASSEIRLLPDGNFSVHLLATEDDDLTEDEREVIHSEVAHESDFYIDPFQLNDDDSGYPTGAVLLRVSQDGKRLLEPAVVYGSPAEIPGRSNGTYQLLRTQRGLHPIKLSTLYGSLPPALASKLQQASEGKFPKISPTAASPIFKLWKLIP